MTYEDLILSIFAEHRGETLTPALLEELETKCNKRVWARLPLTIRSSWRLRLAQGAAGQIELQPQQIGSTPAEELEKALRSEVQEEQEQPPEPSPIQVSFSSHVSPASAVVDEQPSAKAPSEKASEAPSQAPSEKASTASEVLQQAKALGISLPPNESLLGPLLEAIGLATHYKAQAEEAQAQLEKIHAAMSS